MSAAGTKSLASLGAGIGFIAAGVAVAVGAIAWGVHQYKKYEKAAAAAAKVAKDAASAYESVAAAYNKFTSDLSNYKDAIKGMRELTQGTLEYQEAVMSANESARELIRTGDLVEGVDYTVNTSTGVIELNEDAVQKAQ
jgi:hypothetical protein